MPCHEKKKKKDLWKQSRFWTFCLWMQNPNPVTEGHLNFHESDKVNLPHKLSNSTWSNYKGICTPCCHCWHLRFCRCSALCIRSRVPLSFQILCPEGWWRLSVNSTGRNPVLTGGVGDAHALRPSHCTRRASLSASTSLSSACAQIVWESCENGTLIQQSGVAPESLHF